MSKKIALLLISLAATPVIGQDVGIWCGTTKHPNEVTLWRANTAGFESGNSLLEKCTTQQPSVAGSYCRGYIAGVADVLTSQNANSMCLPEGATVGQLVDVVKKYLTEYPATRHYSGVSEIQVALQGAFPCKAAS
jgi:Rap1a immunity proteins